VNTWQTTSYAQRQPLCESVMPETADSFGIDLHSKAGRSSWRRT